MQPLNRFTPMPSIPENKPISYFYENEVDEEYEKALEAIKIDSEMFKRVCEDSQILSYKENVRHNKQPLSLQENK